MELGLCNELLNDEARVGEGDIPCEGSCRDGKHGFPSPAPKCCPGEWIQTNFGWDYVGLERKKNPKN